MRTKEEILKEETKRTLNIVKCSPLHDAIMLAMDIYAKQELSKLRQNMIDNMGVEDEINRIWYQMNMKEITSEEARHQVLNLFVVSKSSEEDEQLNRITAFGDKIITHLRSDDNSETVIVYESEKKVLFNFGKYKNTPIDECEDYNYLCRCVQHDWDRSRENREQRIAINKKIDYGVKNFIF